MKILVVNTGSSSLKFTCFDLAADADRVLAGGVVERIGQKATCLRYVDNNQKHSERQEATVINHAGAVKIMVERLTDPRNGAISSFQEIEAVGHRVVHAGEKLREPVIIDERIKCIIEECFPLAPLHTANLEGVRACEKYFPRVPQVAVFDTAFHATMPPKAFLYGLPYELYQKHKIRRYGFHGTSHKFVSQRAAELLGRPLEELKIITCHLGNGSSIAAVRHGKSVDTSMGMTPLEGLIMGTRCGDLDPAIIFYLMKQLQLSAQEVDRLLNKESGLLGLAGIGSSDLRDIEQQAANGHERAALALEAFCYRTKKYVGAYAAAMGGLDVLAFTAGIGNNSSLVRAKVCQGLEFLGVMIDSDRNEALNRREGEIQGPQSRVTIMIVPTNEELEIARQTRRVLLEGDQ